MHGMNPIYPTYSNDGSSDNRDLRWGGVGVWSGGGVSRHWGQCGCWLWGTDRDSATAVLGVCCHCTSSWDRVKAGTPVIKIKRSHHACIYV